MPLLYVGNLNLILNILVVAIEKDICCLWKNQNNFLSTAALWKVEFHLNLNVSTFLNIAMPVSYIEKTNILAFITKNVLKFGDL